MASPKRYRIGTVASLDPLELSVEGLPVRAEQLIRLRGVAELAKAVPAAGFDLDVGDKVVLLPDDNDACYILLGVMV